jgi:hypothetical protein
VAFTAAAGATQLKAALQCGNASGTARLSGACLVFGPQALEYAPEAPGVEQLRCDRYYEVHIGGSVQDWPYFQGYASAAGQDIIWSLPWHAVKAVAQPTALIGGTWVAVNTPNTAP